MLLPSFSLFAVLLMAWASVEVHLAHAMPALTSSSPLDLTRPFGKDQPEKVAYAAESDYSSSHYVEASAACFRCVSSLKFKGKAAHRFAVGTQIPTLPFKTKNSWAGLLPVTPSGDKSFYFYLWGQDSHKPGKDLVIFLTGGPGCSSLLAMVAEVGPFLYTDKTKHPYVNSYSWTKEANLLFVELPVGVGFTQGKVDTIDEDQLARQFDLFLANFFKTFPELIGNRLFIAAESYAGMYFSYFLNHLYSTGNKYNVQGGMVISGLFSTRVEQGDLVTYPFAQRWANQLGLTAADLDTIKAKSDECKYTNYIQDNLHYPPKGRLAAYDPRGCNVSQTFYTLANTRHSDFYPYRVTISDPTPVDPLGNPNSKKPTPAWFDDVHLQRYIHAPSKKWNMCTRGVFPKGDASGPPDETPSFDHSILASVIERSHGGVVIITGREDSLLITDGTSLLLQNLTWGHMQGFQKAPTQPLIDSDGRPAGTFVSERGLTYAIVDASGHTIPFDDQGAGLAALQVMLGKRTFAG